MSMTRNESIKWLGRWKVSKKTVSAALASAPAAVVAGLAAEDLLWARRHPAVLSGEAAQRLAVRSRPNPEGELALGRTVLQQ